MTTEYTNSACVWTMEPIDIDGTILLDLDSFYLINHEAHPTACTTKTGMRMLNHPLSRSLTWSCGRFQKPLVTASLVRESLCLASSLPRGAAGLTRSRAVGTVPKGEHMEQEIFVAGHFPNELLVKLFSAESAQTSMAVLQVALVEFNGRFGGDKTLHPDRLKTDYADVNRWPAMKTRRGLAEMGEIIQEHTPFLLKRVLSLVPVIFPTCETAWLKVSCVHIGASASPRPMTCSQRGRSTSWST